MNYFNYEEIVTGMHRLADTYDQFCNLVPLPLVTVESRDVLALAIGDRRGPEIRTAVYIGGVHAREWIPPDALLYLAADLLEARAMGTGISYGNARITANDIRQIFSEIQLIILPCANPDGRIYSQTKDHDWRKNRSRNSVQGEVVSHGVDLNRNFDFAWDYRRIFESGMARASSDNPMNKYSYIGPAPASEPETRNIVWLLDEYTEARWFIDVHSYVPAVFFPWGTDELQSDHPEMNFSNHIFDGKRGRAEDRAYREYMDASDLLEHRRLACVMADEIRKVRHEDYQVSASFSLYPTSGTSKDYAYSRHLVDPSKQKIFVFTFECGREWQPRDWGEVKNVVIEVSAALARFSVDVSS